MSRKKVDIRPRGGGGANVSLFPFLAVLLCMMGALIMLLVVIARNVREPVEVIPDHTALAAEEVQETVTPKVVPKDPEPVELVRKEEVQPRPEDDQDKLTERQAEDILQQIRQDAEEADWFAENIARSKDDADKKYTEIRAWLASAEKDVQKHKDELQRLLRLAEQLDRNDKTDEPDAENLKKWLELRQKQLQEEQQLVEQLRKEAEERSKSYAIVPYRGKDGTFRRPIFIECFDDKVVIQPEGIVLYRSDFETAGRTPDNPLDAALRVIRQYYVENNQVARGTEPYPLLIVRPSGIEAYSAVLRAMGSWVNEFGYELIEEPNKVEYPAPSEELRGRLEKQVETSRRRLEGFLAAHEAMEGETGRKPKQFRVDSKGLVQPLEDPAVTERLRLEQQFRERSSGTLAQGTPQGGAPSPKVPGGQVGPSYSDGVYRPNGKTVPDPAGAARPYTGTRHPDISLVERPQQQTGPGPSAAQDALLYGMTMPESLAGQQPQHTQTQPAVPGVPYAGQAPDRTTETAQAVPENEAASGLAGQAATKPSPITFGLAPTASGLPAAGLTASTNPAMNQVPEQVPPGAQASNAKQKPDKEQKRPENWALRNVKPFTAAVKRNIKIQCEADKFVLLQQTGLIGIRVIPITESVYVSADKLVVEIWDFMETWGIAGEKYYWQPVLQIRVRPGGEQRFEELRWILRGSGLIVEKVE